MYEEFSPADVAADESGRESAAASCTRVGDGEGSIVSLG